MITERNASADPELDVAEFRRAMGHFATGLAIVTSVGPAGPVGLVVNSFTSVSLQPPLVLFCAAETSTTWPVVEEAGVFCINVLAHTHEELAGHFFRKHPDRFAQATWRTAASAAPVLDDAVMWLDCSVHEVHPAGDHVIVVGRVLSFGLGEAPSDVQQPGPLLFYQGNYQGWVT